MALHIHSSRTIGMKDFAKYMVSPQDLFEMKTDSVEFEYLFNKVKLITNKQIAVNTVYMTQIISDWERLLLCLQSRCSSNHCCDAII